MTDEQIDDVIDSLLVDIDDPEVRLSLARWAKSTLGKFDLSTLTTEELSEILGNLLEVGDVLKDVEEEIQQRLKPR